MTSGGKGERSAHELTNSTPFPRGDAEDDETTGGIEELNAPANPIIAAAVATSLYGSGTFTKR